MKQLIKTVVLILISACSFGQAAPKLIVRGDDMGFSHSGNLAMVESFKNGIETSIEVIVPSPWFPEAVSMLQDLPNVDVGVHIALTSEWDNVKYRPLTAAKSLVDADGYFYPMIWKNKNYPGQSLKENNWKLEEVESEMRAQIEMAMKKIPQVSHMTGHMGCTSISPEVEKLAMALAKEYGIYIDMTSVQSVSYDGSKNTSAEKVESFKKMLSTLEKGKTYLFVDHPGIDNQELQAIHHIGYENVAKDRQGVTDTFTDASIKQFVKEKGIQLISYKDLKKE